MEKTEAKSGKKWKNLKRKVGKSGKKWRKVAKNGKN